MVKNLINNTFSKKRICLVIFLDISSIFDHVWVPKILFELRKHKCLKNLYNFTVNYFDNRKIILYHNGLILNKLSNWGDECKLRFNTDKTKLMLVTRKLKITYPKFFLKGKELQYVNELNYLGCILDQCLSWLPHIRHVLTKIEKPVFLLDRVATLWWGLNSHIISSIYEEVVIPRLLYAYCIWGDSLNKKKHAELLLKFQRRISIKLIKGYHTISQESALLISGKIPLDFLIKEHIELYDIKKSGHYLYNGYNFKLDIPVDFRQLPHPTYCHNMNIIIFLINSTIKFLPTVLALQMA